MLITSTEHNLAICVISRQTNSCKTFFLCEDIVYFDVEIAEIFHQKIFCCVLLADLTVIISAILHFCLGRFGIPTQS